MIKRVALLGIYHESNTFIDTPVTRINFEQARLLKGKDILHEYRDAFHEIGGMIEVLEQEAIELVPVFYATATPGGIIGAETYQSLLTEMLTALQEVLPVDGCLVVPHGAAVSEDYPDMDGHWLSLLREIVGPSIPITGTLDPHANVSPAMIAATNALVAYKTNPHIDQRETGREAARLLVNCMQGKIKPVQYLGMLPLAISMEQQYTAQEPCVSLYQLAKAIDQQESILSVSVILGFPYADVAEMGSAFIVVTDNKPAQGAEAIAMLTSYVMENKTLFTGNRQSVSELLPLVSDAAKPVLMLDMGDNVGGGAPGNSTILLEAMEADIRYRIFICIHDPAAVVIASTYKTGDIFDLSFGGNYSRQGAVFSTKVVLQHLCDGHFRETTPRHGGQVNYDMGKIAIVTTANGNTVMLTSLRVPPFSLQQLTAFGIAPAAFDIVVAKGVNAPVAAYSSVCPTIMQVDTPGVTQANMTLFDYKHRRKPMFPFEKT